MDFLTFLNDYEQEDVSKVKDIFESNKAKEKAIIEEAFKSEYPSKKEALFNLTTSFIEEATAPEAVDVAYVKENIEDLKSKIEALTEGDIRIIIHNHESKDDGGVGFEAEGAKPKKKRGRKPKKPDFSKPPMNTGVVYEDDVEPEEVQDEMYDSQKDKDVDDIVAKLDAEEKAEKEYPKDDVVGPTTDDEVVADVDTIDADETIIADVLPDEVEEDKSLEVSGKPTKMRWSDIVKQVQEQEVEREGLVEELAKMELDEEELKQATAMAESGEIVEDDSKISSAASLINKINKL